MSTSTSDRGRVLIVDDDQRVLELLVDLLKLEGYGVASASDGAEAATLAHSFAPDVVVSDVVMPRVGGLELCRRLKQDPRTASIPVLLISGIRKADEAGIEGLHAGADDYLDLPFRNEELLVKVARLVERHRASAALTESEERYRRLVELSPDGIVVLREGRFTYLNPAAQRLWRAANPNDLIGRPILAVVHPEFHDQVTEQIAFIEKFEQPTPLTEQKCIRLDGVEIDVEVSGLPFNAEGKSGVLAVFRDVTERKQARESIRDREERYH
jgi:PAS domain S-box-containing protein